MEFMHSINLCTKYLYHPLPWKLVFKVQGEKIHPIKLTLSPGYKEKIKFIFYTFFVPIGGE